MKNKKNLILLALGITAVAALYVLVEAANINPLYPEGMLFWCALVTAYGALYVGSKFGEVVPITYPNGVTRYTLRFQGGRPKKALFIMALPWIAFGVLTVISSPIFGSAAYRDQLGEPEIRAFSSDMQVVDMDQVPIVDATLALNLADKKLGEKPSLGSQVHLGEPTIQQVNGKLVWVVPLHHSGLFKWLTNMQGTPGYVVVSATNLNDVTYVEDFRIKYHPNSFLLDDLQRHLRLNGALFSGITDYSFELDDGGQPYWIVTAYRNTRGFALPEAHGIFAVNASTGETTYYDIANVPDWVDRVQPEQFILQQIVNQGEYVHGIFNFSDKDKFRPSRGMAIIYNEDRCYLFTGLTSIGQDESAIGFMMVDMVTKQPLLFQMNGATEESAQASAEGKVQHLGYRASAPIILNIEGQPTYFMPLKDNAGLIKQYAFVSVVNYSDVGVGETMQLAVEDYRKVLSNSGVSLMPEKPAGEERTASGTILRISPEYTPEGTRYVLLISGVENRIFTAQSTVSPELALTCEGDAVTLKYYDTDSSVVQVFAFDNTLFQQ